MSAEWPRDYGWRGGAPAPALVSAPVPAHTAHTAAARLAAPVQTRALFDAVRPTARLSHADAGPATRRTAAADARTVLTATTTAGKALRSDGRGPAGAAGAGAGAGATAATATTASATTASAWQRSPLLRNGQRRRHGRTTSPLQPPTQPAAASENKADVEAKQDAKKTKKEEEEEEEEDLDAVPSDTLAALQYLRGQFPRAALQCAPVVLVHQLYTVVHSKTAVDRDLDTARVQRQVLKFRLPNGAQDIGLLLLADYRELLAQACSTLEHAPEAGVAPTITDRLLALLESTDTDVSIGRARLMEALPASDAEIIWLVRHGFLTLRSTTSLWFAVPSIAPFLVHLGRGRTELLAVLKRRQYREIMEKQLRLKRLQRCALGWNFLLTDAIGSGHIDRLQSPDGPLLRLVTRTAPS